MRHVNEKFCQHRFATDQPGKAVRKVLVGHCARGQGHRNKGRVRWLHLFGVDRTSIVADDRQGETISPAGNIDDHATGSPIVTEGTSQGSHLHPQIGFTHRRCRPDTCD